MRSNFFEQKIYEEVILNERTIDQIMSRLWSNFINDKCNFQEFEHCKSSLED